MALQLEFEGIRCFATPQVAQLRPLTLLVGENSSGETTFLALCQAAAAIVRGSRPISFNDPPFLLGAYDQIASYRGGRAGRAKSFYIRVSEPDQAAFVEATFAPQNGQPQLKSWRLSSGSLLGFRQRHGQVAVFRVS